MATESVIYGASAEQVQRLLQQQGQAPALDTAADGTPVLRSAAGGWSFSVFFFNAPQESDYSSIQFNAGFEGAANLVHFANEWNKTWRFSKALALDADLIILQQDVVLRGVTEAHLRHSCALWEGALARFGQELYG